MGIKERFGMAMAVLTGRQEVRSEGEILFSAMNPMAKSVPNFDPYFLYTPLLAGLGGNSVQVYPGMFHATVYACCTAIIDPYKMLKHVLMRVDMNGDEIPNQDPIENHEVLRLMAKPNPHLSGTNFFEAIWWALLLQTKRTPGGQAFVVSSTPCNFRKGQIPDDLWVFTDEYVTPLRDSVGVLSGWKVQWAGDSRSISQEYALEEVIRINLFNPYDNLKGISPSAAASVQIGQDSKAMEFNSRFMEKMGSMGGVFSPKTPLTTEQINQYKALIAEIYSGPQNAGKPLFLNADLSYQQTQMSHVDMAFVDQAKMNTDKILNAFRVNKYVLGSFEEINYAIAKEAKRQIWENAILPRAEVIWQELNESWIRFIGPRNLRIKADISKVEALKEDRSQKIDDASKLVDLGLPPSAAFEFVELPIDTTAYPWMQEDRSMAGQFSSTYGGSPKDPKEEGKPEEPKGKAVRVVVTKDERANLSKWYTEKLFVPGEKAFVPAVNRFLSGQRNRFLDLLDAELKRAESIHDLKADAFLLDDSDELKQIISSFGPFLFDQAKRSLFQAQREIAGKKIILNADSNEGDVKVWLKGRLLKLSEINDTTFEGVEEEVSDILSQGIGANKTIAEIKKELKAGVQRYFDVTRRGSAMTIARTEIATVTSTVRFETFKNTGIQRHEWVSSHDAKVRDTHKHEDGHVVEIGAHFPDTGLLHPCDPAGPPEEIINCRCVDVLVRDEV